jgi:hypothetical protein
VRVTRLRELYAREGYTPVRVVRLRELYACESCTPVRVARLRELYACESYTPVRAARLPQGIHLIGVHLGQACSSNRACILQGFRF